MSDDRRERILVRLEQILHTLAPTGSGVFVYRNRAELDDNELPAYVLLDGDEERDKTLSDRRVQVMRMTPQIFWVPQPPENQVDRSDLGPDVSARRAELVKAVMLDGRLADLVGPNGYVEYRGMITDMQTGGEILGQLQMNWAMGFVLNISKL